MAPLLFSHSRAAPSSFTERGRDPKSIDQELLRATWVFKRRLFLVSSRCNANSLSFTFNGGRPTLFGMTGCEGTVDGEYFLNTESNFTASFASEEVSLHSIETALGVILPFKANSSPRNVRKQSVKINSGREPDSQVVLNVRL